METNHADTMRARIANWDKAIEELTERAQQVSDDVREDCIRLVAEAKEKRDKVAAELRRIEDASGMSNASFQALFENAAKAIQSLADRAYAKLSG